MSNAILPSNPTRRHIILVCLIIGFITWFMHCLPDSSINKDKLSPLKLTRNLRVDTLILCDDPVPQQHFT